MNTEAYAKLMHYIDRNPMAVLGTINDDGTPHGAVVYVCGLSNGTICLVTKNQTRKYANLIARPTVSLTIGNDKENSTLQASGQASVISDAVLIDAAMKKMIDVHAMTPEWLPPLAKLRAGNYAVIKIEVTHARLGEFKDQQIGSERIYTEI